MKKERAEREKSKLRQDKEELGAALGRFVRRGA